MSQLPNVDVIYARIQAINKTLEGMQLNSVQRLKVDYLSAISAEIEDIIAHLPPRAMSL